MSYLRIVFALLIIQGCAMAPVVQLAKQGKSGFDGAVFEGEIYVVGVDATNNDQYRLFSQATTGFVSLEAIKTDVDQRASEFCRDRNQTMKPLTVQTSVPPHILGNFPRAELVFICLEKQNEDLKYNKLINLKKLLDGGVLTREEFDREKEKLLNSIVP